MAKNSPKTAKKTAKKKASKAAKSGSAAKSAAGKSPGKKTKSAKVTKTVKKAAKKTVKKAATKTVKKAATKTVKKAATKTVKKAVTKTVKKAATKTVKKAAKKTVKKVTKKAAVKKAAPEAIRKPRPRKALKSPLCKKDMEAFRGMLLEKRRQLMGDMSGMEAEAFHGNRQEETGDLSNMPVHMADIGTDNYEQEFTLGLLESERQLLGEINQALGRISDGLYGLCMGIGEPIGIPRLRAKPWAKYSIEYARRIEQGQIPRPANDYGQSDDDLENDDE